MHTRVIGKNVRDPFLWYTVDVDTILIKGYW